MTLANAIVQVHAHFPGTPQHWKSTDGTMPYRVLMAYVAMLPAKLARERVNLVAAHRIAQGGEDAPVLWAETLDEASPP